jgi:putative ABC transport system permease protein
MPALWMSMLVRSLLQDLRFAWRGLSRAKGFAAAAVLTMAVGVGGTSAMFALIQGVLLRPLPVPDQDRLVVAWKALPSAGVTHWPLGRAELDATARASRTLAAVGGASYYGTWPENATERGLTTSITTALVTGAFFDVLGVRSVLGRTLNPRDDVEGAEPVIVITHGLWQRRYGGARDVIGRRIRLDERSFTVIGVMPPDLDYPRGVEAWRPLRSLSSSAWFRDGVLRDVDLVGRLRAGATIEHARSELAALFARLDETAPPDRTRGAVPIVGRFDQAVVGDVGRPLLVLFAAVVFVMLIAAANLANLLLVRGEARAGELAIRAALGAGRSRVAAQVVTESVLLAIGGGTAGILAAWFAVPALVALVPDGLPRAESVRVDGGVAVFAIVVALGAAALASLAPALWFARTDVVVHLRAGTGRDGETQGTHRRRRALVVLQAALAVMIVAGAGLVTRSLLKLQSVDLGLPAHRLVLVWLRLPQAKYADDRARRIRFLDDVVGRLEASPGIVAATPVNVPPFASTGWDLPTFTADGQTADDVLRNPALNLESVYPNYFRTFELPIVRGRGFTPADREGAPAVAILSDDVAARTWPGEDPIGKRIKMGGLASTDSWLTVVGLVRPTRYRELARPRPTLYLPAMQFLATAEILVVRTAAPPDVVGRLAHAYVHEVDPDVDVLRTARFAALLEGPLARPRFNAVLIGLFAAAALLLATVGLYAVTAADVRRRRAELGVRLALGATPAGVRRLVLVSGLRLAAAGAAIGLAVAAAFGRLLRGLLYGVHPLDPETLLLSTLLLLGLAAVAAYVPARRAARLDPVTLLRTE